MNACAELFIANLKAKGLHYGTADGKDGDVIVDFPYDGKVTKCIFGGEDGKYFSLYLLFESVPQEKIADVIFLCNELNTKYKWVTFYVDSEGDLIVHDDAILSVESAADEAFELLLRTINISGEVKPQIMKTIYA